MIRLRTFGGVGVLDAQGSPLTSLDSQRRLRALLVLLCAAGERGLTRDKLLAMLWPDAELDRARHSLTQALYSTRRATGLDDLFETSGVIRVNARRITVDFLEFEQAVADGDHLRAVGMYAGPFLDGFSIPGTREFADWVGEKRAKCEEAMVGSLDALAERAAANGDHPQAIVWRRHCARLRPLDTAVIGRLAISLGSVGDRAGIVRIAAEHEEMLRDRLGLKPDPGFGALIDHLCRTSDDHSVASARPAFQVHSPAQAAHVTAVPDGEPATTPANSDTIGRLRRRIRRVVAGGPPVAQRAWVLVGLFGIVAAGLYELGHTRTRGPSEVQAATTATPVAVAPFSIIGADPSIKHLGLGLPELLAVRLAEDSTNHVLESARIFSQWKLRGLDTTFASDPDALARLGSTLGVSKILVGRIVGTRARTVAAVSLFSVARRKVVATAELEGPSDSVGLFSEELAIRLLINESGDRALEGTLHPHSLLATKDFLEARAASRRGEYAAAVRFFQATLKADTAFTPALVDLAVAAQSLGDGARTREAIARVWDHRAELDRQRLDELIAMAGPAYPNPSRADEQLAAWEALARREPQRQANWVFLARRLVQDGARLGYPAYLTQATTAANRAIVISPDDIAARTLVGELRALDRSEPADRAATSSISTAASTSLFLQWIDATRRRDDLELEKLRGAFAGSSRTTLRSIALFSQHAASTLADGRAALEALQPRAAELQDKVDLILGEHSFALNRGDRSAALIATTRLHNLRPDSHADLRLRALDGIYGSGDEQAAEASAAELTRVADSSFVDFPLRQSQAAADACVVAQWRLAHSDTVGVGTTISQLRRAGAAAEPQIVSTPPIVCADLLTAALAVETRQRNAKPILDRLDSLVLTPIVAGNGATYAHLLISRLYGKLGDDVRALRAVKRRSYLTGWAPYAAATWAEEGRLRSSVASRAAATRTASQSQR